MESFLISKGLTPAVSNYVTACFKKRIFKKGELFVKEGKINNHMAFVQSGLLQYFSNLDGKEKTTYIAGPNSFVISLKSYFRDTPALENIRALTVTECYLIDKPKVESLLKSNIQFRSFYLSMLSEIIICLDESRFQMISLSAEQRYQLILNSEPSLVDKIPLQYLASILGVTPRHLSRIRSELK